MDEALSSGTDEALIPVERRRRINAWACERASVYADFCRKNSVYAGLEFESALYEPLKMAMIAELRERIFARLSRDIPVTDNSHADVSAQKHPSVVAILLTRLFDIFQNLIIRPPRTTLFAIHGAFKSLGPVMESVRLSAMKGMYFDTEFRKGPAKRVRKLGVPYAVFPRHYGPANVEAASGAARLKNAFVDSINQLRKDAFFVCDEEDLGDFLTQKFAENVNDFAVRILRWKGVVNRVMRQCPDLKVFLTDALPGSEKCMALTIFFRSKRVRVFWIMTSPTPVDFAIPPEEAHFFAAETFVQSERDRRALIAAGWNPKGVKATGLPRFDSQSPEKIKTPHSDVQRRRTVLFHGCTLKTPWAGKKGYLGHHLTPYGHVQRRALNMLFEAMRGREERLRIMGNLPSGRDWAELVASNEVPADTRMTPFFSEISSMLRFTAVLVTAHWSEAIEFALLQRKPVIFIDLYDTLPNGECQGVRAVRTTEDLKTALAEAMDSPGPMPAGRTETDGGTDGRNAERVLDLISEELN